MYISKIKIINFRNFKEKTISFNDGVNVIIGHNNAGKTNLIKALSLVINTNSSKKLGINDFCQKMSFNDLKTASPKISIEVTIAKSDNETPDDLATIGNWLTTLNTDYEAVLTYEFFLPEKKEQEYIQEISLITDTDEFIAKQKVWKVISYNFLRFYIYKIWGGNIKNQTQADSESLQKFDFQFLDAIRDVERDMFTGKNTLLKEVLNFFIDYEIKSDNTKTDDTKASEIKIKQEAFAAQADQLLLELQNRMEKGEEQILSYAEETGAAFGNANPTFEGNLSEVELFSALKLIVEYETGIKMKLPATHNGLGYNNLIFMSLLLAQMQVNANGKYMGSNAKVFTTLAIEEPEAHLHPSMQYKFLKFLKENKKEKKVRQIFVTTHSTHITSAVSLDEIICLYSIDNNTEVSYPAKVFPNDKSKRYVQRFLDATKSDMLFAQRIIMVEGLAEQLLISILAKYKGKSLEDNHVAIINVGGRYFEHFLHLFDSTKPNTINKRVVCLTDRDPTRKQLPSGERPKKCYPFEFNQDTTSFDYKDNATNSINQYSTHPNIRFYSQDVNKGKTLEYDFALHNPSLKILVTDSISNKSEIEDLMDLYSQTKPISDFLTRLSSSAENTRIKNGINSVNSTFTDDDKRLAIIASRYLNSVEKGENALELTWELEENLLKMGTSDYKTFIVPQYIINAITWICQ